MAVRMATADCDAEQGDGRGYLEHELLEGRKRRQSQGRRDFIVLVGDGVPLQIDDGGMPRCYERPKLASYASWGGLAPFGVSSQSLEEERVCSAGCLTSLANGRLHRRSCQDQSTELPDSEANCDVGRDGRKLEI